MTECQHTACTDTPDTTLTMQNGEQYDLCEDHAHMQPDGTPVSGYTPNNPEKFN